LAASGLSERLYVAVGFVQWRYLPQAVTTPLASGAPFDDLAPS
jgi:hypothetical protein